MTSTGAEKMVTEPLSPEEIEALATLADQAVPNWSEWFADDHKDWAQPSTYVEAKDRYGDRVSIVRFVEGEPQFWCTVGKAEYEWANARFVAASNPLTIKRLLNMLANRRTPGTVEVCEKCGRNLLEKNFVCGSFEDNPETGKAEYRPELCPIRKPTP